MIDITLIELHNQDYENSHGGDGPIIIAIVGKPKIDYNAFEKYLQDCYNQEIDVNTDMAEKWLVAHNYELATICSRTEIDYSGFEQDGK